MGRAIRALLVVDAEGFSRNRDVELPRLHTEIHHSMEDACDRSGLGETWRSLRFLQSTGDGLLAILPLDATAELIHPFMDRLQDVLAESAPQLRADGLRLRLRGALHVGLVDDEDAETAGISTATNDVCRLLDCQPLRAALRDTDPDVTFVAVLVSAEAFEMFVRGGYTDLNPSQFTCVRANVKQFDRPAYLYIPKPFQAESQAESLPDASFGLRTSPPGRGSSVHDISITGDGTQNVIGNQVGGSIRQERS